MFYHIFSIFHHLYFFPVNGRMLRGSSLRWLLPPRATRISRDEGRVQSILLKNQGPSWRETMRNPFRATRISSSVRWESMNASKLGLVFHQLSSALRRGSNLAQSQVHFKVQSSLINHDSTLYFLEVSIWRHTSKLGTVEINWLSQQNFNIPRYSQRLENHLTRGSPRCRLCPVEVRIGRGPRLWQQMFWICLNRLTKFWWRIGNCQLRILRHSHTSPSGGRLSQWRWLKSNL